MKKAKFVIHPLVPVLLLGVAFLMKGTAATKDEQAGREVVLSVSDPRLLGRAAELLQLKLGVAISYEDAGWAYNGDFARAADTTWGREIAQLNPQFKAVIPVGCSLEIRFPKNDLSSSHGCVGRKGGTWYYPFEPVLQRGGAGRRKR